MITIKYRRSEVVDIFNTETKDVKLIAKKLGMSEGRVRNYISEAKKYGEIVVEKKETKKEAKRRAQAEAKRKAKEEAEKRAQAEAERKANEEIQEAEEDQEYNLNGKLIKLYNSGIIKARELAKELDEDIIKVYELIDIERKKGTLLPIKDIIINKYNSGTTKIKELMEELEVSSTIISRYIKEGRKEGKLPIIDKRELVIELFNLGVTKTKDLAEEAELNVETVRKYLKEAAEKNQIKRIDKEELLIELFKSGITNVEDLAEELEWSGTTVRSYIRKVAEEGKITIISKKEKMIELFNDGMTNAEELAKESGISVATLRKYKKEAIEEGKITIINRGYLLIELFNRGITNLDELEKETGYAKNTIKKKIREAKKEGKIKIVEEAQREEKVPTTRDRKRLRIGKNRYTKVSKKEKQIKELYEILLFPIEIAKRLGVQASEVYKIMENMSESEKTELSKRALVRREYIYEKLNNNENIKEELIKIETEEKDEANLFELAEVYYILGAKNSCKRVLENIEREADLENIRNAARIIWNKCDLEFKAQYIRKEYNQVAKDSNNVVNYDYDRACRKYAVSSSFVEQVLGKQDREITK